MTPEEKKTLELEELAAQKEAPLPTTPEEFRTFMREELSRYRQELGLHNPPGENGIPLPSKLKKGEHLIRNRTRLPEDSSLDEAMKKAGVSRKGRRAYLAALRSKNRNQQQKSS